MQKRDSSCKSNAWAPMIINCSRDILQSIHPRSKHELRLISCPRILGRSAVALVRGCVLPKRNYRRSEILPCPGRHVRLPVLCAQRTKELSNDPHRNSWAGKRKNWGQFLSCSDIPPFTTTSKRTPIQSYKEKYIHWLGEFQWSLENQWFDNSTEHVVCYGDDFQGLY